VLFDDFTHPAQRAYESQRRLHRSVQSLALHEAGHALLASLEHVLDFVEIDPPRGEGHCRTTIEKSRRMNRSEAITSIAIELAGSAAELRACGIVETDSARDHRDVSELARAFANCDRERRELINAGDCCVRDALSLHWSALGRIANALLQRRRLTAREVAALVRDESDIRHRAVITYREPRMFQRVGFMQPASRREV
jgi:ATP-dependent Zn protease